MEHEDPRWTKALSLISETHNALTGLEIRHLDAVSRLLATHLAAAVRRVGTVHVLISAKAYEEAAIVARSILELAFSAAYVFHCTQPNRLRRAERFDDFEAVQLCGLATTMFSDPPADDASGYHRIRADRDEALQIHANIERCIKRNWTGLSGWKNVISAIEDEAVKAHMLWLHDVLYFHLSLYVHPTPSGVRHTLRLPPLPANLPNAVVVGALNPTAILTHMACGYAQVPLPDLSSIAAGLKDFGTGG